MRIYYRKNRIDAVEEIHKLRGMTALTILILSENPITSLETYRSDILSTLQDLQRLDKEVVNSAEMAEVLANLAEILEPLEIIPPPLS